MHRISLGLPASSLDLTAISNTGYLAEDLGKTAEVARSLGSDTICKAEVLALLGAAIGGRMATTCNSHIVIGMRTKPTMQPRRRPHTMRRSRRQSPTTGGQAVVCDGLVCKLAAFDDELEDLDVTRSLSHYPLDSLVAIEIRNFNRSYTFLVESSPSLPGWRIMSVPTPLINREHNIQADHGDTKERLSASTDTQIGPYSSHSSLPVLTAITMNGSQSEAESRDNASAHEALLPPDREASQYGTLENAQDHVLSHSLVNGDIVTDTEDHSLKRGLGQRHLSMLGIAGAIGTGLFLGLGGAVQKGGPLGALLGYATIGLVVCAVQFALGEVSALLPVTGSFVRHAEFLVDPALGFAVGWNLVYGNILAIPSEITAICVLFQFWTDLNPTVFILISIVLTVTVGVAFVRVFGEVEFIFALLKIFLVFFLIILGLMIDLGGVPGTPRIGFAYWRNPGPFVENIATGDWGRFLGYWSVMTSAVFSFAGVESLAMAAAETHNPQQAIPAACKRVFIRIVIFYMLAILVVGMLVASNDPRLNDSSGSAAQSPFVIAASAAGIPVIPTIVNAVVITSAWSASNQSLLAGTRVLYGLALKGQAPKIFLRTTSWGTPYMCVLLFAAFMFLSFMSLSNEALTVFWWLVRLTAAGVLVSWSVILLNHVRLRLAMKEQGISEARLPWHNWWTLYSSYAGLFMCIVILLTGGFEVFTEGNWDSRTFVSSYLDIPLVLAAYFTWKFVKKTKVTTLSSIPLDEAFEQADQLLDTPSNKAQGWTRVVSWVWE
ncbi:Uu.00g132900.m01.CDS01 [Anthostomella pinea]|uniref:Uu.00g132900.m01.CDS01 n=1 Tax=Anthostomella pinea TaxID=933095 RepID=A0AAI8VMC3_9PEZI|nr:Uu.00g132900.m01.CDS01 [Anthostomella pinea]